MKERVVHVEAGSHAKAKEYCKQRGMSLRFWVSQLILEAVDKAVPTNAVRQMRLEEYEMKETDVLRREPFWKGEYLRGDSDEEV